MKPPRVRVTDDMAYMACTINWFGWRDIRRICAAAGCGMMERRVGLFTKTFKVTGGQEELSEFVHLAWYDPVLGPSFRRHLAEAMSPSKREPNWDWDPTGGTR